jgi:hypothetical protein
LEQLLDGRDDRPDCGQEASLVLSSQTLLPVGGHGASEGVDAGVVCQALSGAVLLQEVAENRLELVRYSGAEVIDLGC